MQRRVVPLVSCLVAGVCFLAIACPSTVTVSACDGKTNGGCLANAQCIASATNEVTCKCPQGYEGDGKTSCTQVATCTIIHGAILCMCVDGYSGNGKTCTKNTTCAPDPCDPNANCTNNLDGGAACACRTGFTTETSDSGTEALCLPPDGGDACDPDPCTTNATCTASSGGPATCTCNDNYTGDGITSCLLLSNGCVPDPCGTNSTCTNDHGVPTCTCETGYLSPSGTNMDCRTGNPGDQCSEPADCLTGVCLTSGECSFAQCTVPSPTPSQGSCVIIAPNAPDAGQDAGLDDAGNASVTVCNPVTNAGCSGGDQCGLDNSGQYFFCQPDAGLVTVAACKDCTSSDDTCAPGMLCTFVDATESAAQCAPLCCSDDDCGDAGTCAGLFDGGTSLGVCSQF